MVNLTKDAPKISLAKDTTSSGEMRVNLNWSQPERRKGFWSSLMGSESLDLDLGCLYELADGTSGVIQALGDAFGSLDRAPYIQLDQDDRSGQSADGENLFVNMGKIENIKRLVIFAFIYEGAPSWDVANGEITIYPPKGEQIKVKLDAPQRKPMCAIASVSVTNGEVSIQREVKYYDGHESLDKAYKWGLRWVAGSKD